jgi:hypothetical protein
MLRVIAMSLLVVGGAAAQEFTRGVGIYPGDLTEDFSPSLRLNAAGYRNLALRRPAYHSSSYDYNLTAQLVTDGIKDSSMPRWVSTSTSAQGALPKNEREHLLDHNWVTSVEVKDTHGWVQIEMGGGEAPIEVDRIALDARVSTFLDRPGGWTCTAQGSDDGQAWKDLGRATGTNVPPRVFQPAIGFKTPARYRFYRVQFDAPSVIVWRISEIELFDNGQRREAGGPFDFTSAWMPAGTGQEWVYVDLGAPCDFDRVLLYWIGRAQEGALQVSDDAANWTTLQPLPVAATSLVDDIKLAQPAHGRYVRLLVTKPGPQGYVLSEMEVYGRGGPLVEPHPAAQARPDGRLDLAGGAWRIERDSRVTAGGEALSKPGFQDRDWLVATVPGTVLTSYYNAGALPDPNFGGNQLMISDSYFYADFWYRNEFVAPKVDAGKHVWLDFSGVNWKADVFLNGEKIGRIEGAFIRARFDVTAVIRPGQKNALAVRVEKNASPGSVKEKTFADPDKNGGALGADNPTFHASIGWDWMPTIRGRDTGIWNSVSLSVTGPVTVDDPYVTTTLPLPDTTRADVAVQVTLHNLEAKPVAGTLRGRFGEAVFEMPVSLAASAEETVRPALRLANPKLWWPAGYGAQNLYSVELKFETADKTVSDIKSFLSGVRQFTYSEDGGALRIWINGRRLVPRGGNWGFSESMLRYRAREYDVAARYHREQNFTMIRNWVGQVGEDAFYEACDRHGIVVWQDFWLANPYDGPDPDDNAMFLSNARDTVLRLRNHPSIGLYCGRNEGFPPQPLDDGMRKIVAEFDPGVHYIPNSAAGVVSGGGPYRFNPPQYYFDERATPKLHSELGMPNVVTLDSLRAMMPEAAIWPQGDMWGLHDFCSQGAQNAASWRDWLERRYGPAPEEKDWLWLSQFMNYEGYRAMFEAQSKNRMGVLLWMSHPAWPSLVWQTYDYYFEPTAAYFGAKKGSEPLHIQWNQATDTIEVVNYSAGAQRNLTAEAEILNLDGLRQWQKTAAVDSAEDSVVPSIHMEYPAGLTPAHFIRLKLTRNGRTLSENFYWRGTDEGSLKALRTLPKVALEAATTSRGEGERWLLTTTLRNTSSAPALMVRLKVVRNKSGDRILPAFFDDNYVALMPGERRTIHTEVETPDTRGEDPRVVIDGFNVSQVVEK